MEYIQQDFGTDDPYCFPIACINASIHHDTWYPHLSHLIQKARCTNSGTHPDKCNPVFDICPFDAYKMPLSYCLASQSLIFHYTDSSTFHVSYHYREDNSSYLVNSGLSYDVVVALEDVPLVISGLVDYGYVVEFD